MTIKEHIIIFLKCKDWVNKGTICNEVMYKTPAYGDTIARRIRELVDDGKIEKRKLPKGTEYRLIPQGKPLLSERIKAHIDKKQPSLFDSSDT